MVVLSSPLLTLMPTAEPAVVCQLVRDFVCAAEQAENLLSAVSVCARPSPALRFRFPREGRGCEEFGYYRYMQTFLVSVCGHNLVTLGSFVCAMLQVGLRAVPSKPQAVLVVVGGFLPGSRL